MGLGAMRLHPVRIAALAEYELAVKEAASLTGEWVLRIEGEDWEAGSLRLMQDGSYALTDTLMNREARGAWVSEGEHLVLRGGYWGEGDAYVKHGAPGQVTVIAGGSEWVGTAK